MSEKNPKQLTFAILDHEQGISEPARTLDEEFPLPAWYRQVRSIPLDELGIEDISKAIRQNIHLEHVVPLALRRLQCEPLAGEIYDGELLVSLKSIPLDYWTKHEAERLSLQSTVKAALQELGVSDNVRQDVTELLYKANNKR